MVGQLSGASYYRPAGSCGDLRERVMRIGKLYRRGARPILAAEVRSLKLAARAWRFDAVESLAQMMEADLADLGAAALIGAYIERMDDAINCDDAGPVAVEAMFATIRARMVA